MKHFTVRPANDNDVQILGRHLGHHDFFYFRGTTKAYNQEADIELTINRMIRSLTFTTLQVAELIHLAGSNATYASDYLDKARKKKN